MSRLTHNIKLLGLALVLSICSAYIIRNPEFLMSSVLQKEEEKHLKDLLMFCMQYPVVFVLFLE
jgi:hypothetical protein